MQQFYSRDVIMSGDDDKDNRSTKVTFPQQDDNMPLLVSYKIFNDLEDLNLPNNQKLKTFTDYKFVEKSYVYE
jgi:hypothetical protein